MAEATRAVILAAGRGGRLQAHTNGRAKCLVPVEGRPLVDYVLSSLREAGISDVVIVLGHHGEQIEAHVRDGARHGLRASYAWNEDYSRGNASSLLTALPRLDGRPFLLVMSDHLCSVDLLRTILAHDGTLNAIAVDGSPLTPERAEEATKVEISDGRVVDLGKQLECYHAVDTGFSRWEPGAFASLDASRADGELAALMARLSRDGNVTACDVSGHVWFDVDTEDDLREAELLLRSNGQLLA